MVRILYKTHNLSQSVQANKRQFSFKTLFNFWAVSAWYQLVIYHLDFIGPPALYVPAQLSQELVLSLYPSQATEGLMSRTSPWPQSLCHAEEPVRGIAGGSGLCQAAQLSLQGLLGWHSTGFSSPVLFSCVEFIYTWLWLSLQRSVLGLSLLPETWRSLKRPWVLVSVLFLSWSPRSLPLATMIQQITGVLCHGHFFLYWKIIQTQKFDKNTLISYGEFL